MRKWGEELILRERAAVYPRYSRFFPAILVIEFVYAIVGIVWLTQYYTSCNDITAKSVTLGMELECGLGASFIPACAD